MGARPAGEQYGLSHLLLPDVITATKDQPSPAYEGHVYATCTSLQRLQSEWFDAFFPNKMDYGYFNVPALCMEIPSHRGADVTSAVQMFLWGCGVIFCLHY